MKETGRSKVLHGIGRRKSSVARVWLKPGKGSAGITVNGSDYNSYFHTDFTRKIIEEPFKIVGTKEKLNVQVNVLGGGLVSQAGAIRLGISRALISSDEKIRPILKKHGLLSCDSRVKERKKYGQRGARRKFQFVKR